MSDETRWLESQDCVFDTRMNAHGYIGWVMYEDIFETSPLGFT